MFLTTLQKFMMPFFYTPMNNIYTELRVCTWNLPITIASLIVLDKLYCNCNEIITLLITL